MKRRRWKSVVGKTVVKKEIIEIVSETVTNSDIGRDGVLARCGEVNVLGDDVLAKNPKKFAVAKPIVKKEIVEIKSGTDEVSGRMLALCSAEKALGDGTLAKNREDTSVDKTIIEKEKNLVKNPKKLAVAKPIVKNETVEYKSDRDEVSGRMLALCSAENTLGDGTLAQNPENPSIAKTIVKKDVIEIESNTDTDEVSGRMLALCGAENDALEDVTLAENPENTSVAKAIVEKEIIEIESDTDTDEVGGRMLGLCGAKNALGRSTLAQNLENTSVAKTIVEKEIIEIDSDTDTDEVGGRMLGLCGAQNALRYSTSAKDGKKKRTSMQIVRVDDCNSGLVQDLEYKKYLYRFTETDHPLLLEDNVRDSNPVRLMYKVDHKASYKSKGRAINTKKSRVQRKEKSPMIFTVSKRFKTENGRADHHSVSRTILRNKETHKKISVVKNSVTQGKKGDVQRGRIISVAKEKEKSVKLKPTSKAKSQIICRASKKRKTEIERADYKSISKTLSVVNSKDAQRMKQKHNVESKILVTKHNVKSKSTSHVKDSLLHSFNKENEDISSSMEKNYAYFLDYLRYSNTIFKSDQQVKPVKEFLSLSDPDIIAVSDHPFPDGDKTPFEATKDGNVIDLEDGIDESYDIFNSLYSKKLMDILRKPFDEKEFLRLYYEASRKRPLTRTRQLRDGREIQYDVEDQLTLSYLETYSDFNTKYHHYRKDLPRALNLLRGFFFYLENIVLEGAFKPWLHEKRLKNMCLEASGCKYITYNK